MVAAIVIAGGVGRRMGADVPKQFVEVGGRPVIAYTLEAFERHPDVDAIEVVCLEGWEGELRAIASRSGISKLRWVAPGGATGQESIRNGVYALEGELDPGDVCLVHDGVRPMLDPEVISDVVRVCRERGNAVSSMPYNEQIFLVDGGDPSTTTESIPRETVRRVSTPQAYRYGELLAAYREAFERGVGVGPSDYANTMMVKLGVRLNFAAGSDRNVKLTTPENLEFFRAWATGRAAAGGRALPNASPTYFSDVREAASFVDPAPFEGARVLVTGATGLIGSAFVDVLLEACPGARVTLAGRDEARCLARFSYARGRVSFAPFDAAAPGAVAGRYDHLVHCASPAHPAAYAARPVETMLANLEGTRALLECAGSCGGRLLYVSSSEVYGRGGSGGLWREGDSGSVDPLDPRSCYPSSKRAAETLCASWRAERGVDFVVVRPGHVYGPTASAGDSRAHAQFARAATAGEPVVMRSEGGQLRSYVHGLDCATAMLAVLARGESGSAYNVSNRGSVVTVRQMAEAFAEAGGVPLVVGEASETERAGYGRMERSALDAARLEALGWRGAWGMREGAEETVAALREVMG